MKCFKIRALCCCILLASTAFSQAPKKQLAAKRITTTIKIDGVLDDAAWKEAAKADKFIELRPTPFKPENEDNKTEIYFVYDNQGIYVGGYLHEKYKDSIASELTGRDGFGNNDFLGVVFDTYYDKLNGFEYFVTPLGEQMDAKVSPNTNGNSEDFSWNAVWESKSKIQADGWSFEMFIPYSAIRFGKKNIQDWGMNIVRRRQKSGQQLFWQPIDPNANGFLTQEGLFTGLQNIKPPFRLQFSPYLSSYINHDENVATKKTTTSITGGMDVKLGLNQAFTLDLTLIPDFGQVQSDNVTLNLTPFEQQYSENRAFFTEGTELFNKAGLFYSRRVGAAPGLVNTVLNNYGNMPDYEIKKNPGITRLYNATKFSGRTKGNLGIGIFNAVTAPMYAKIREISTAKDTSILTEPLTNYNIIVFDQALKNRSSVSFTNTNVLRKGNSRNANVSSLDLSLFDKKNNYNFSYSGRYSSIWGKQENKNGFTTGAGFGKVSGIFQYRASVNIESDKYDPNDLGFIQNNNSFEYGGNVGYIINKPTRYFLIHNYKFNFTNTYLYKPFEWS